jgi:predicted MFS family arabinose efflux permease
MKSLYGLTDSQIGMAYVPFGLATVVGTLLGGKVCTPFSPCCVV